MRRLLLLVLTLGPFSIASLWAEAPNIIFITVDTARADRMGFLGNRLGLTPNLDAVARQGVVFEKAFSQAPLTPVSMQRFLPEHPQFHTVTDFGHPLPSLRFCAGDPAKVGVSHGCVHQLSHSRPES
jgi:arylsulfatase A-like enzyme